MECKRIEKRSEFADVLQIMLQLYETKITAPELVEGLVILASESTKLMLRQAQQPFCALQHNVKTFANSDRLYERGYLVCWLNAFSIFLSVLYCDSA